MPATNMYRVTQVLSGVAGAPYYITGYFDSTAGTAQAAATAWRALIGPAATDGLTPLRAEPISTVDLVSPVTGDTTESVAVSVGSLQYTGVNEPLPPSTTLLLRWRTGIYVGGREVRGRTNISRIGENESTGGEPTGVILTAYQGRIQALLDNAAVTLVVWSRKSGEWFEVTSGSPSPRWCVLRSRRD